MKKRIISIIVVFVTINFNTQPAFTQKTIFKLIPPQKSGVYFNNKITESDSLHVLSYEYLYNGHGMGVSDFNNDGLLDLFISGNMVRSRLYLNKGEMHFVDVTNKTGIVDKAKWATGVSIVDINADGLQDIYICYSGSSNNPSELANELYLNLGCNDGIPSFKEVAKEYGLDATGTQSTQAAFFDYDKDGDLDLFLLNHSKGYNDVLLNTKQARQIFSPQFGNRLFRNDSGNGRFSFVDVTRNSGINNNKFNYGLGLVISDVNNDGWPDIYTSSDYHEKDALYINNRNGTFRDVTKHAFGHIAKFSMGADIADFNNDGLADILNLDMLPEDNHRQKLLKGPDEYDQYHLFVDSGFLHQNMRNMLQLNRGIDDKGNTRFSEIGQLSGVSNTDWSWAGLFVDLDNDGWKDIIVTNGYLRDFTDLDFLKYTVAEEQILEAQKGNLHFKTFNLVKKMPSNKLQSYIFKNNKDLTFSNVATEWGITEKSISNAAVYADLDNDGDYDLIIGGNNHPVAIYQNNTESIQNTHYIKIHLKGEGQNINAFGAKVFVYTKTGMQFQEAYPIRGFQSSVTTDLVFGMGNNVSADSIIVEWPNGKKSYIANVIANKDYTFSQKNGIEIINQSAKKIPIFSTDTTNANIEWKHTENEFIDFKSEVLLPYQLSKLGPALAKGDVNNDGLDDIYLGGAVGHSGKLFIQTNNGFVEAATQPWSADMASEDVNAIFFDVDRDGDQDLYVVSGGNEYENGSEEYADRLYINDGKGGFNKNVTALPLMLSNKQAVAIADFDADGDMDIFIGGAVMSGSFPNSSRCYLLRNDSKSGQIMFTDATEKVSKELLNPGMVTSAVWADVYKDGFPELMLAGDWMPLLLFNNKEGILQNISDKVGLSKSNGLWSSIVADDIDNDGDIDFVAGNSGLNNQFKASEKEPMTIYANDFDDNGVVDPIICYYIQGKNYPMASRDELLDQIVPLRKKYVKYKDYADAKIEDIFPKEKIITSQRYDCYQLASSLLINNGKGQFSTKPLPVEAQFSKVFGLIISDFDKDGKKDLLISGNFYPYRVQLGMNDASMGVYLKGNGDGNFKFIENNECGFFADGDIRQMVLINRSNKTKGVVVGRNNDSVKIININK